MASEHDVAIVGAGPYGLSLASHLNCRKIDFQIFGEPMQFWRYHMPKGMHLKSDGFASNLYDPRGSYPLRRYCQEHGIEYRDSTNPVELETFVNYGLEFQKSFVPDLRTSNVLNIEKISQGFFLALDTGDSVRVRRVVIATGIRHFRHIPSCLKALPAQFVTHSSGHHDLAPFKDREVVVLGAGASATDLAALLQDNGANVQLVVREDAIRFHSGGDGKRSLFQKLRHPGSGIGPGWRARFYCDAPWLFHYLPERLRLFIVRRTLGPAGGWFMKDRVMGQIPILVGSSLERAEIRGDRVHLRLRDTDGRRRDVVADHVIAATGYRPDLQRLQFLSAEIRSGLKAVDGTPILSSAMESSIPDLYFTGAITSNSFGPVMRFAFGARFAAARIARALAYDR